MIIIMSELITNIFSEAPNISLERNETLFHTGDDVTSIYLVTSGQVELIRYTKDGVCLILQTAEANDVLAEASLHSLRYHCDAKAAAPSTLKALLKSDYLRRVSHEPLLAEAWAQRLALAVQSARIRAEIRTLKTVAERLEAWLDSREALPPKGRWQNLAQELGVSKEALYRELAKRRPN